MADRRNPRPRVRCADLEDFRELRDRVRRIELLLAAILGANILGFGSQYFGDALASWVR